MSTNNKEKIKKPIVKEEEPIIEEENNKSIILLGIGIVLVIGLIIGVICYLNSNNKKEESEGKPVEIKLPTGDGKEDEEDKKEENTPVIVQTVYEVKNETPTVTKYAVEYYKEEELISKLTVESGKTASKLNLLLNENEVLKYWYYLDSNNAQVVYDFSTMVTNDLKLYAKIVSTHKVEFKNLDDEDITDYQIVEHGEKLEELDEEDLIKNVDEEFYKVIEWYTDKNLNSKFNITDSIITEDLVLYGKYERVYRARFYLEPKESYEDYSGKYKDKFVKANEKIESITDLTHEDMVIKSWNTIIEQSNPMELVLFDFDTFIDQNIILVPLFGYSLTYDTNGGNEIEGLVLDEGDLLVEPVEPVKPGYKFDKWVNNEEETIDFTVDTILENTVIYAEWTAAVTFETYGGSTVEPVIPNAEGKIIGRIAIPVKEGYEFNGWYYDEDFLLEADFVNDTFLVPGVLYAKWVAKENTLTYHTNTGVNTDLDDNGNNKTVQLDSDEEATLLDLTDIYTKEGYILLGWSTTENGDVDYELNSTFVMGTTDQTLYAVWGQVKTLTINLNGGTDAENEETTEYEHQVLVGDSLEDELDNIEERINPPAEGEVLIEFNTLQDGTGDTVTSESLMPNTDFEIYAIWELEL